MQIDDLPTEETIEVEFPPIQLKPWDKSQSTIHHKTEVPARYRQGWTRPTDETWVSQHDQISSIVKSGGIVAIIGNRGTGKTRHAAEVVRNDYPETAHYTTAMGVFLRVRSTYHKDSEESEAQAVKKLCQCPLLIIDEAQERGNTGFEDRILTHIIDSRYSEMKPTILIANLTAKGLFENLGSSIVSRLMQTGAIIEITGKDHRKP